MFLLKLKELLDTQSHANSPAQEDPGSDNGAASEVRTSDLCITGDRPIVCLKMGMAPNALAAIGAADRIPVSDVDGSGRLPGPLGKLAAAL